MIICIREGRLNHYYKLHFCLLLTSSACIAEAKRHFLLPTSCSVPKLWPIFRGNVFYVKDEFTAKSNNSMDYPVYLSHFIRKLIKRSIVLIYNTIPRLISYSSIDKL